MLAHTLRLQVTITAQLRPVCLRSFSSKILKTQLQTNLINQLDKIDSKTDSFQFNKKKNMNYFNYKSK